MCYGWLITRRGKVIAQGHGTFAHRKNANSFLAEYLALISGLEALVDLGAASEGVEIRGDAKSVIDQMRGTADVNAASVRPLHRKAKKLAARLKRLQWVWRPRRENRAADLLSRRAMHQLKHDQTIYQATVDALQANSRLMPVASVCVYL